MLAYVLTNGPEAMRDLEAAHGWYERAAAAGSPEGCLGYALSLAPRTNDAAGRRQVADYLGRAAQAMLPTAVYLLGVLAEQGVGVARDPAAALELYRNAAELGVRSAQTRWGLALIEGKLVKRDLLNGETWLRRAALAGDAEAAVLVADLNINNGELPPNYTQAAGWYRRAAEAGNKAAARALGSLYLNGDGVAPTRRRPPAGCASPRSPAMRARRSILPISCSRAPAIPRIPQAWHNGSSRRRPRGISWLPSISGLPLPRAWAWKPTTSRPPNGCARPPRACRRPNISTAGCWPTGAALPRT